MVRMRGAVGLLAAVVLALVTLSSTEKVLEAEMKSLTAASNALIPAIEALMPKTEDLASNTAELGKMWRLVRNQKEAVEMAYRELSTNFSMTVRKSVNVATIDPQEQTQLSSVFFSGEPHFVQCISPSDPLHRAFIEAAPKLTKQGITPAALDCSAPLPSGKTTFDRFFSTKNISSSEPFFFAVANRDAPRTAQIKNPLSPESLIKFAALSTESYVTADATPAEFKTHCVKKKLCAVFLYPGDFPKKDLKAIEEINKKYRKLSFLTANSKKLTPSFKDIMGPDTGGMSVVFLRQSDGTDRPLPTAGAKPVPYWEGKAWVGDKFTGDKISAWIEDAVTGYLPLKSIKTTPQLIDLNAKARETSQRAPPPPGGFTPPPLETGGYQKHPKERDTSHYAENLRYHTDRAAQEEEERLQKEARYAKRNQKKSSSSSSSKDKDQGTGKREGGGFKTKAKVSKEEQAEAKRAAERKRREEMEKEKRKADGIEFLGEDGGEGDQEPDADGYYHYDAVEVDEDEQEL